MTLFKTSFPFLYLVLDPDYCTHHSASAVARMALQAGVKAVQLRSKTRSQFELLKLAEVIKPLCLEHQVPFIINDHLELARDIHAEGLHLGQEDTSPFKARDFLGPRIGLGLSISSLREAQNCKDAPVDYWGIGPLWSTQTKECPTLSSPQEFNHICALLSAQPCVAIGGIHPHNIIEVKKMGASAMAVVSAICSAQDPYQSTLQLLGALKNETF